MICHDDSGKKHGNPWKMDLDVDSIVLNLFESRGKQKKNSSSGNISG